MRWAPEVWERVRMLYWQRQCMRYTAPAGQLVSAEPLPYGGRTPPFVSTAPDPPALAAFGPFVGGNWPGPGAGPVIFLHERRTAGGVRRLVVLRRTPPGQRQSWDIPLSFTATLVEPGGLRASPGAEIFQLPEAAPSAFGDRSTDGPLLRFFAAQVDAADDAHFVIPFELNGDRGLIDGWLRDGAGYLADPSVELRVR
jgi:hypothetical protein